MALLKTGSAGENINSGQLLDIRLPKIMRPQQESIMQQVKEVEAEADALEQKVTQALTVAKDKLLERVGLPSSAPQARFDYYSRPIASGRLDFEFNNPKYETISQVTDASKIGFAQLADVAYFLQDSWNPTEFPDVGFMYADIGNVDTKWGELHAVPMMGREAKSSRMRRVMYDGAVLVSTTRPTRNAIGIVPKELDRQVCSTGFAVLKCKPMMNNRFLFHALRTWLTNLQFAQNCSGSGYPAINQETDLPRIKVPLPPNIDDQVKIAAEVDALLTNAKVVAVDATRQRSMATLVFDKAIAEFM